VVIDGSSTIKGDSIGRQFAAVLLPKPLIWDSKESHWRAARVIGGMKQDVGAGVASLQPKVFEVDARQLGVKGTLAEREHLEVSGAQRRLKIVWVVKLENATVRHDLHSPECRPDYAVLIFSAVARGFNREKPDYASIQIRKSTPSQVCGSS
jgi:hypothetical protein